MREEQLKELGLEADVIAKVLKIHKDSIDGNYVPKATFEAERENVKTLKNQITERDNQITELTKFKGTNEELQKQLNDYKAQNEELQKQLNDYKTKNEELKANSEKEIAKVKKENLLKFELKDQVIDVDDVLPKLNIDNIVFENDAIKSGLKEQLEDLRKSKPHYFAQQEDKNKNTGWKPFGTPPTESGKEPDKVAPEVDFAKQLAQAKNATTQASQKALETYFK